MRLAAMAAVTVAISLIVLKGVGWLASGSVALLSSLGDSVVDAMASLVNLMAVRHALKPADEEHRFGHGKVEALAALFQAGAVIGTGAIVIMEAIRSLVEPRPVAAAPIAIVAILVTLIASVGLVWLQRWVIRRTGSTITRADSLHYQSDVLLNLTVLAALLLTSELGWYLADPLLGLAIAGYILYGAWAIGRLALDMLMDRELPARDRARIEALALAHGEVRSLHRLRTRQAGPDRFVELHLRLDGHLPLTVAHRISHEVKDEILAIYPDAQVLIHEEPEPDSPDVQGLRRS